MDTSTFKHTATLIQRISSIDEGFAVGDIEPVADIPKSDELAYLVTHYLMRTMVSIPHMPERMHKDLLQIATESLPEVLVREGFATAAGPTRRFFEAYPPADWDDFVYSMLVIMRTAEREPLVESKLKEIETMTKIEYLIEIMGKNNAQAEA